MNDGIGWVREILGVNCQERTREELIDTLRITLREALVFEVEEKMENTELPIGKLIDLQVHCFRLGELLNELDPYAFSSANDWLTIASGVESVKVRTAKHDETVLYCRGAFEYEDKRSELLSHLTTKLTIFNFVWGSFESLTKALLKKKHRSIVELAISFLKQHYGSEPSLAFYNDYLCNLYYYIEHNEFYKSYCKEFKFHNFADLPGLGLHIVRKIRNELAHSSAAMPRPDDWGEKSVELSPSEQHHLYLVDTCTRILLFTIQMLLLAHTRGQKIIVNCLFNVEGDPIESTVHLALHQIHIEIDPDLINWDQLSLFDATNFSSMNIPE